MNAGAGEEPASGLWVVSPFTVMKWHAGRIEITSIASGSTLPADDLDLLRIMHAFARPHTAEEVVSELGVSVASIDDLIRSGVLTSASTPEPAAAHHWECSALAFHRRSRHPGIRKTEKHATSATAIHRPRTMIPLGRGVETARDVVDVLEARRSWRAWSDKPIRAGTFGRLLWLSARDRGAELDRTEDEYISRPYPSGGAAYSLEIYPVLEPGGVESIAGGMYRYLPAAHALEPLTSESSDYLPFLEAARRSAGAATTPPVLLIIASRFARQSESYGSLAYSLVLKEVGCLFQTLYLVAEYLELAPCALGGGTSATRFARILNRTELAEPVVGEFILGPR